MLVNIEAERVRQQMTKEMFAKEMGITLKTYGCVRCGSIILGNSHRICSDDCIG